MDRICHRPIPGFPPILFEVHSKERATSIILGLTALLDACEPEFSDNGKLTSSGFKKILKYSNIKNYKIDYW